MPYYLTLIVHIYRLLAFAFQALTAQFLIKSITINRFQETKAQFSMDLMGTMDYLLCQFFVQHNKAVLIRVIRAKICQGWQAQK